MGSNPGHQKTRARTQTANERIQWRATDSDIWSIADQLEPDELWSTSWVNAHADEEKEEHELTNEERGNVAADKLAEKQYDAPHNIERPWETTSSGQVIIETKIRQYHAITGNTTKTILKHTRRMNTRAALDRELAKITGAGVENVNFQFLDMDLQESIEKTDKQKGLAVTHMKLTAGMLATNDRLATYTDADAKCPCCSATKETQGSPHTRVCGNEEMKHVLQY